jgi:hypothetical protein
VTPLRASVPELAAVANLVTGAALAGLIWTVQLVHYPAFRFVEPGQFAAFHAFHSRAISFVVVPLMAAELAAAVLLAAIAAPALRLQAWVALGLVLVAWTSTFLVQVPLHGRLGLGHDADAIERLITTNWVRTAAWSLKLPLALRLLRAPGEAS